MKKYLLFRGASYYPSGGWDDFDGDFDSIDEAKEHIKNDQPEIWYNWYHIVDTESEQIVAAG